MHYEKPASFLPVVSIACCTSHSALHPTQKYSVQHRHLLSNPAQLLLSLCATLECTCCGINALDPTPYPLLHRSKKRAPPPTQTQTLRTGRAGTLFTAPKLRRLDPLSQRRDAPLSKVLPAIPTHSQRAPAARVMIAVVVDVTDAALDGCHFVARGQ
jgi:hypothetical protein